MAKRKTKRNARKSKGRGGFKICRQPIVRVAADALSAHIVDSMSLPRVHGRPILFAIARDAHTIFVSWNIDWESVLQKTMPADRQVHLQVIGGDGVIERRVAVEPVGAMHYLTMSGLHHSYRVEIGYFQPFDTWHSVATSDEIEMPARGSVELADVDLTTIPFHLSFQQILDLFGTANGTPLSKVVSEFQKCALRSEQPNEPTPTEKRILHKLNLSLPEIAAAQHDFEKSDSAELARRTRALLRFTTTSPSRAFEANSRS